MSIQNLYTSFTIDQVRVRNRLAVAPLTRVSAHHDGTVGPFMKGYYERFALGGFGLIITEGLYTDQAYSQAYENQPGISSPEQADGWRSIVQGVHKAGAKIFAQLMHAGALSQYNRFAEHTVGPSSVQPLGAKMSSYGGSGRYLKPQEMTEGEISDATEGFAKAAYLAKTAGFDGVEIHGANGYLLDQFLTAYTNQRRDQYGGALENRLRLYKETIAAVRAAVGKDFIVGVRFSQKKVNDTDYVWADGERAADIVFGPLKGCGASYIHTTDPDLASPAFEGSLPLASLAKKYGALPVIGNGGVTDAGSAERAIEGSGADLIALGRAALANPDWPRRVLDDELIKPFDFGMLHPRASLENEERYLRERS